MPKRRLASLAILAASALAVWPAQTLADCKLLRAAEFHVDLSRGVPVIEGQVNGESAQILIDSGADTSMVVRSEAIRRGLDMRRVIGVQIHVVGGSSEVLETNIKSLKIDNFSTSNLPLLVTGPRDGMEGVAIILGDDFLSQYDVEFDLANSTIRLFEPQGCSAEQLVYWGKNYAQATLLPWQRDSPVTQANVILNGKPVLGEIDSGATGSVVDAATAAAVGVNRPPTSARTMIGGFGPRRREAWTATFDSFAFGDEKIANARLAVADLVTDFETDSDSATSIVPARLYRTASMLIGADFLKAHRVYVGNKEHVIVFSYNGGAIFRTAEAASAPASAPQ
ncbi:MAG: retropepsin-like aspartic protease [Caulobacterales bacterium]